MTTFRRNIQYKHRTETSSIYLVFTTLQLSAYFTHICPCISRRHTVVFAGASAALPALSNFRCCPAGSLETAFPSPPYFLYLIFSPDQLPIQSILRIAPWIHHPEPPWGSSSSPSHFSTCSISSSLTSPSRSTTSFIVRLKFINSVDQLAISTGPAHRTSC